MSDNWSRFRLQRKLFSIGEDFWIENEQGQQVYKVDGKAFSLRETFLLEDANGSELLTVESKLLAVRPTMKILRQGDLYATVTKKLLTFLHQHYTIEVEGGVAYEAEGNITSHEYEVTANGTAVANISKNWFTIADSYGVAIAPGQDPPLLLAAVVCIDEIAEAQSEHHH
ncbi:MAG TPA: LURP-one-related family protein [Candidatus Acidoferrum sp.]|nr:LURP-one-related family protein [Candidatus Acidoferrum sp.]